MWAFNLIQFYTDLGQDIQNDDRETSGSGEDKVKLGVGGRWLG